MTAVKMRSSNAATRAQPVLEKIQHGPSSHDLVSHATAGNRADLFFGVKVIQESWIDLSRSSSAFTYSAESAKSKLARLPCS
jgi:hypothetical protein